jgi:hypothetical protein
MKNGVSFQGNYTFSKLLTDSIATAQTRIDTYLDNARPRIDRGRSEYDIKHGINANFAYELPFGRGKMLLSNANGVVNRVVGGWQTSGIMKWQSGSPVSIISGRGTFNRATRATEMAANSSLSIDEIKNLMGIYRVNGFAYAINPAVLNPASGISSILPSVRKCWRRAIPNSGRVKRFSTPTLARSVRCR